MKDFTFSKFQLVSGPLHNRVLKFIAPFLASLIVVILGGCDKESIVPVQTITGNQNSVRELVIEVRSLDDPGLNVLNPLADVDIRIFDDEENFIIEMNEVGKMTTDSTGTAVFRSINAGYYYVIAVHPSFGRLEDGANVPAGAIKSRLELIYF